MDGLSGSRQRTNWAGNIAFGAREFHRPATIDELRATVARAAKVRVLGTGHSFSDMADSSGTQVSLAGLPPEAEIDSAASLVQVAAGLSYAELAGRLDSKGLALANLASLPHISVAGACATATHGSGLANQSLAAAVAAMEIVTAEGDLAEIGREPGAVVHLGALGVVTRLVLDVVPAFSVSQRVYENLPLEVLDGHFAEIMSAGYSVSLFTDWRAPRLTQIWVKQRAGDPAPPLGSWFTATPAPAARNPVPGASPDACTEQLGVPGPWYARLPHFRPEFTPSAGHELQSEYLLPVEQAVPALHALSQIGPSVAPVLQICEVRVIAADQLWLSPCYRRDTVAFHFTWIADTARVLPAVRLVEEQLAPLSARPHWGKVFTTPPEALRARYDRLPDFIALMRHYDPTGKFRNAYTDRNLPTDLSQTAAMPRPSRRLIPDRCQHPPASAPASCPGVPARPPAPASRPGLLPRRPAPASCPGVLPRRPGARVPARRPGPASCPGVPAREFWWSTIVEPVDARAGALPRPASYPARYSRLRAPLSYGVNATAT